MDIRKGRYADNQADVIEAFNSASRYLDDPLNIDTSYLYCQSNLSTRSAADIPKPPLRHMASTTGTEYKLLFMSPSGCVIMCTLTFGKWK